MDTLHCLLMKTHLLFHKKIMTAASSLGLTSGQPKILEFLSEVEKSDQQTIASHCEIERATATGILQRMEQNGLIYRSREDGNKKSVFVTLTEKGKLLSSSVLKIFDVNEKTAFVGFTPEEQSEFIEKLKKLYENLLKTEE